MRHSQTEFNEAVQILLAQRTIFRDQEPVLYQLIRQYYGELSRFFREHLDLELARHATFFEVKKIPLKAASWMQISGLNTKLDYALLACVLAFTETRGETEPFLLTELTENIEQDFPLSNFIDWTSYQKRLSLVHVLQVAVELRVIEQVDGLLRHFEQHQEAEILFRIGPYARFLLADWDDDTLLAANFDWQQMISERQRNSTAHVRVLQQLLFTPGISRDATNSADFSYIRHQQQYLEDFFSRYTDLNFELTKDTAVANLSEPRKAFDYYPSETAIQRMLLLTATIFYQQKPQRNEYGQVRLSFNQWQHLVGQMQAGALAYLAKKYQQMSEQQLSRLLLNEAVAWGFVAQVNADELLLTPLFIRQIGYLDKKKGAVQSDN